MGTKWWCLILTCFSQALGLSLACALSMDSLQDSKVGNFPHSCVQYSMSVLSIFLYFWWGITGLPLLYGAFLKTTTFFFPFENHPVFWAVTLQHSTAEWLRWERFLWRSSNPTIYCPFFQSTMQILSKYRKMGLQNSYDSRIPHFSTCVSSEVMWGTVCSFSLVPFFASMISNHTPLLFIILFTVFSHPSVFSFMQYFTVFLVFYQHRLWKSRIILFRLAHWEAPVES